jgi:uncharacterized protein with von Willebrand factor type A (vWA) domain
MTSQELEKELEQEYERFVEFGGLLDQRMRRYLVQYLQNKFEPERHVVPDLNDQYYDYFRKALDDIFLIDGLIDVTQFNEKIRRQVILDTLYWLRKTYAKIRTKNPYADEQQRLESWAITPLKAFVVRWPSLPTYLSAVYPRDQLDYSFFRTKFEALIRNETIDTIQTERREKIEIIFHDLLAQWDALLHAKILDHQFSKLAEAKEEFVELLDKKVKEYSKLRQILNPFTDFFGWDLSRKLWRETSFDVLNQYDDLLQNEQSIKELADLLGNMREAEIEIEEEELEKTIIRQEWVTDESMRSQIVGVHESDDLNHLLSSEAGLLSDEQTETLFLKKYADKQLMTFRYEDRKLIQSEDHFTEINQRINQKEKGPFIVCVDTSESMEGRPEQIAKVLTLGILKMAMHQNRRAYLINFSTGIQTLDLHDIANHLNDIANFLRMSFYGGTDATLALHEAIRQLQTNDYEDADVLMVSDFIMHKLDDDILGKIGYFQQNKNTQFHCLTLGENSNPQIVQYFDTNWVYSPKEKGIIRSLTHGFRDIKERY